jgi:hypothetical protein
MTNSFTIFGKVFGYVFKYADINNVHIKKNGKSMNTITFTPDFQIGNFTNRKFGGVKLKGVVLSSEDPVLIKSLEVLFNNSKDGLTFKELHDKVDIFAACLSATEDIDHDSYKYIYLEEVEKDVRYLKHRIVIVGIKRRGYYIEKFKMRNQSIIDDYKKLL